MKVKELTCLLKGLDDLDILECSITEELLKELDAKHIVHGHWIEFFGEIYRCSVCRELRSSRYNDVQNWKYCPCGAKMDEVS